MPIYTVVMHKAYAGDAQHAPFLSRQLHLMKGVVPVLAAPDAEENEGMLQDAITQALQLGLVSPGDAVVCIMALKDNMVLKVCGRRALSDNITSASFSTDGDGQPGGQRAVQGGLAVEPARGRSRVHCGVASLSAVFVLFESVGFERLLYSLLRFITVGNLLTIRQAVSVASQVAASSSLCAACTSTAHALAPAFQRCFG